MYVSELRAALAGIHQRWEHGHDGLVPDCTLCAGERDELAALTAVSAALRPQHQAAPLPARTERRTP